MVSKTALALSALMAAAVSPAAAATVIDFTEYGGGDRIEGPLAYDDVVFSSSSGVFTIIDSYYDDSNTFCAYDNVNYFIGCIADWTAEFEREVANLSFRATGQSSSDSAVARVFDAGGNLLDEVTVDADGVYGFSTLSGISRLALENTNTSGRGMSYTDVSFDVAPVPLPAGLPLALVAFGGLGLVARRKR